MSHFSRARLPGGTYFFTTHDRIPDFAEQHVD